MNKTNRMWPTPEFALLVFASVALLSYSIGAFVCALAMRDLKILFSFNNNTKWSGNGIHSSSALQFDRKQAKSFSRIICVLVLIFLLTKKWCRRGVRPNIFSKYGINRRALSSFFSLLLPLCPFLCVEFSWVCVHFLHGIGKSRFIYLDKNGIYVKGKTKTRLRITAIALSNKTTSGSWITPYLPLFVFCVRPFLWSKRTYQPFHYVIYFECLHLKMVSAFHVHPFACLRPLFKFCGCTHTRT